MGKKQHQKDKMYLTTTEWTTLYGGKRAAQKPGKDPRAEFRRLPFNHCSLSLQPFEVPYCCEDGAIFDLLSVLPYLKKYGHHPLTGKPMDPKSLVKLNFHKNADGKYHCPVTFRVFNANSHIVAIKTTGNVYSFDAVERLNIKPKNFKDLVTDEPFKRTDIITLQDPTQLDKFNMGTFHHLKHNLKVDEDETAEALKDPTFKIRTITPEMKSTLETLEKEYAEPEIKIKGRGPDEKATMKNAAHYSMGRVSASLTSTIGGPQTVNEAAVIDKDTLRYKAVKKKGYVRIHTNHGDLNVELHCDMIPKTCENFIILAKRGYYNGTVFHRSIRNFMIQGGDPTATGTGGESAWGSPFKDEFKPNLIHQGRGILSMANSGPNTNKSQFFITFRSCRHLDNKHSVFGRIVGGIDVLNTMEKVETDDKDRPLEEIKMETVTVFVDPYEEVDQKMAEEEEEERRQQELEAVKAKGKEKRASKTSEDGRPKVHRLGIGKYISKEQITSDTTSAGSKRVPAETAPDNQSMKKKPRGGFGNFSNW